MTKVVLSIITPCYNEELNVENCAESVRKMMQESLPHISYEHIFADNSSLDQTVKILKELAGSDSRIKIIVNSRNVGPFRNMWNAMKHASGSAVIPMLPADLQDPVWVIPSFIKRWESGDLVVYGVRTKRQEHILMRATRNVYYRIIKRFATAVIPINSGEFLLVDRRVLDSVLAVDDQYPYIRGLIAQTSVKSSSVPYAWVRRSRGKSKNSFIQLLDQAINGFVSTSRVPARLALLGGFFFSALGILGGVFTFVNTLISGTHYQIGIPTLIVCGFFFGGVQLFFLGIIGEYVLSIHGQVRKIPAMFELEIINFEQK